MNQLKRMNLTDNQYREIEKMIESKESVVGIDAKKTHILIIHLLQQMNDKLNQLETRIDRLESGLPRN